MGKGSEFERKVAKDLTIWLIGTDKPYKYWRMPASGGLATIHEECAGLSGDIRAIAPDAEFLTTCFSIECKTGYQTTSFWQNFNNIKNYKLREFWAQCCGDARKAGRHPLLIYRKMGKKPIIGIEINDALDFITLCPKLDDLPCITIGFGFDYNTDLGRVAFYGYENFWEVITPDIVKRFMNYNDIKWQE